MSERNEGNGEEVSGGRGSTASDGWSWTDPHWEQRVAKESILALVVEALRRGIDLRDASAESSAEKALTHRAVLLMSVLNALFKQAVAERADSLGLILDTPYGTGSEIVQALLKAGMLTPDEYRSSA
jgi:hypothetical protein